MRLPGVWLYGALTIGLLATAGFIFGHKWVLVFAIVSAGFAYAAEYLAQEIEWGRDWNGLAPFLQLGFVLCSVSSGFVSFFNLVA